VLIRPAGSEDRWTLPKGHLEKDEQVMDAAMREVREETGLEVASAEPLGVVSYVFSWREPDGGPLVRIFKRVHYFLMEHAGGDVSAHDAETAEVVWLPIDDAVRRASYKNERELLEKARAKLAGSAAVDAKRR